MCMCFCEWRPEEGVGCPRTEVIGVCERPNGFWELNSGPLEEEYVLLTTKPVVPNHPNTATLEYSPLCCGDPQPLSYF